MRIPLIIAAVFLTVPLKAAELSDSPSEATPRMITVDAKLIEISQTKMRELGVTLSQFDEKQVTKSSGLDCFDHVSTSAINGFVDSLIKNKIACILSNPRVATLECQEASLSIGSQVEKTTTGNSHYVQLGTRLSVVPTLLQNDNVQLHFMLEWSGHSPTDSEQGEKHDIRNFEFRTSTITPLGQSTLLTRSLEMAEGNSETVLLLIVTPELVEATANAKNAAMK